jgi:hypothetical protein
MNTSDYSLDQMCKMGVRTNKVISYLYFKKLFAEMLIGVVYSNLEVYRQIQSNSVICLCMALQPFVGRWLLFHFLDILHSR